MKLRNNKVLNMTTSGLRSPLGRRFGNSLTDDGVSIGDNEASHPNNFEPKTPDKVRKTLTNCLNFSKIFPESVLNSPDFKPNVCLSDITYNRSVSRTPKHKKYNLKNFHVNLLDILPMQNSKSLNFASQVCVKDCMNSIKSQKKNLQLVKFNARVALEDIMFAPVDNSYDENRCIKYIEHGNIVYPSRNVDSLSKLCGDGKAKGISKCINRNGSCKLRDYFVPSDRVVSTSTHRVYDVIVPPGTISLD